MFTTPKLIATFATPTLCAMIECGTKWIAETLSQLWPTKCIFQSRPVDVDIRMERVSLSYPGFNLTFPGHPNDWFGCTAFAIRAANKQRSPELITMLFYSANGIRASASLLKAAVKEAYPQATHIGIEQVPDVLTKHQPPCASCHL